MAAYPDALFKTIRLARSLNVARLWSYKFDAIYVAVLNGVRNVLHQISAYMGIRKYRGKILSLVEQLDLLAMNYAPSGVSSWIYERS